MKTTVLLVAIFLISIQLIAAGATLDRFQSRNAVESVDLSDINHTAVVNITIPAECHVLNATLNVTGVAVDGTYPISPELFLNDTRLWTFNGTGYGALGRQSQFSDNSTQMTMAFGAEGGSNSAKIRLPKDALVMNATMDVYVAKTAIVNFTGVIGAGEGDPSDGELGCSVSDAGDVNNDGYDDVIVGVERNNAHGIDAGCAYIYLGGPSMNNTPDLTLTGEDWQNYFGCAVSGAEDVNNDGCDDVIVGAYGYDAGGTYTGRAYIYFGGPAMNNVPDVILTGEAEGDDFGWAVSGAGDVNADGYNDVIVGAVYNDAEPMQAGLTSILAGRPWIAHRTRFLRALLILNGLATQSRTPGMSIKMVTTM
jgi:hypothetical protein